MKFIEWLRFTFRGFLTPVNILHPGFRNNRQPSAEVVPQSNVRVIASSRPVCLQCGQDVINPITHKCLITMTGVVIVSSDGE